MSQDPYKTVRQRENGTFVVDPELRRRVLEEYDAAISAPASARAAPPAEAPRTEPIPADGRKVRPLLWHIADAVAHGHYDTQTRDRLVQVLRIEGLGGAADAFAGLPEREWDGRDRRAHWAARALEYWITCGKHGVKPTVNW